MASRLDKVCSAPDRLFHRNRTLKRQALLAASALLLSGCTGLRPCGPDDAWFSRDKAYHFFGSAAVAAGVALAAEDRNDREDAGLIGFSAAMTVGAGKELIDDRVRGTCFSWKDLFWDFLGASAGATAAAMASE
jgi:putative lipoprotein